MHGFELVREQEIPEYNSLAKVFRHIKTGAQLISLENDDENKSFCATFPTFPEDSTGIAHILEHSVLAGSRKYQVKEPFLELIKGSLQTFVNASTYYDKTIYPVASTNTQDFYNLVDVYLDAVFYPLLPPRILAQEGWHYELESLDGELGYRGIVFNEMKGAYSSPDDILEHYTLQSLFPDNLYRFDAGGDPSVIPNLTYENFKKFHETHYHPSNALIWFYGDDPTEERLKLVNEFIGDFEPLVHPLDTTIPLQKPFDEPHTVTRHYAVGEDESDAKCFVVVNWVLSEPIDPLVSLSTQILARILIGRPASPLRKVLIESGLGEDLAGSGLETHLRQMMFSTGLRGVDAGNEEKVETLILETLDYLVTNGLDPEMIESALNSVEFHLREANFGGFPRGLALGVGSLTSWLYGGDPLEVLSFEKALSAIKESLNKNPRYFEEMIETFLLTNTHRSTVILAPDPELAKRLESEEKQRLIEAQAAMNQEELLQIIEETKVLKEWQETPDTAEELAKIPRLTLDDLELENTLVPLEVSHLNQAELVYHDLFTNGIVYLDLGFDLHTLAIDLLPYISLFSRALLEMGTQSQDFVQLSNRIDRETGGIRPTTFINDIRNDDAISTWLFLRTKALTSQTENLLNILRDILMTVQLDNQERFTQMVLEEKASMEAALIPQGHVVAFGRLKSHFSRASWIDELTSGTDYLFFLRDLAEKVRNDWTGVLTNLESLRKALINRQAMVVNVTLDAENFADLKPQLESFLKDLPSSEPALFDWEVTLPSGNEGLTMPAQVNYVAKGTNIFALGYELDGSVSVIGKHLSLSHLWEKVRVMGGAYGAFAIFDPTSGTFTFASYRDPNLINTVQVYDTAGDYLRKADLSPDVLTGSIIGAISSMDQYELPDSKGFSSLQRYLVHYTDEMRQKHRAEILSTTPDDFREFADVLDKVAQVGEVVVLGSPETIAKANEANGGKWLNPTKIV